MQVATVLRVFGFQFSVFGESQEFGTEPQNLAPGTVERRPDGTELSSVFHRIPQHYHLSAYGDPAWRDACFENGRLCRSDIYTEG
jgi:hypothetical protein